MLVILWLIISLVSGYLVIDYTEGYNFNLTVGNQVVDFTLDTSVSDTLLYTSHKYCSELLAQNYIYNTTYGQCLKVDIYNVSKSDTFIRNDSIPAWSDSDQSTIVYEWGSEVLEINGTKVTTTLGLLDYSPSIYNTFALGFPNSEVTNLTPEYNINQTGLVYANFLQSLRSQGIISRTAYSLVFNDDETTGRIILGGIDQARYRNLVTLPINDPTGTMAQVSVDALSMEVNGDITNVSTTSQIVQILNGYNGMFVPDSIFDNIIANLDVIKHGDNDTDDWYQINKTSIASANATLNFVFGGLTIDIPWEEFTYDDNQDNATNTTTSSTKNDTLLTLSIYRSGEDTIYIGDALIRHTYYLVDMEANTISLGNLVSTNATNIQSIDALPVQESGSTPSESTEEGDGDKSSSSRIGIHWLVLGWLFISYIQLL